MFGSKFVFSPFFVVILPLTQGMSPIRVTGSQPENSGQREWKADM